MLGHKVNGTGLDSSIIVAIIHHPAVSAGGRVYLIIYASGETQGSCASVLQRRFFTTSSTEDTL